MQRRFYITELFKMLMFHNACKRHVLVGIINHRITLVVTTPNTLMFKTKRAIVKSTIAKTEILVNSSCKYHTFSFPFPRLFIVKKICICLHIYALQQFSD